MMKTWHAKPGEVEKKWWLVDASGKTLGRVATEISKVLRGKHRPQFSPHMDNGDFVIVVNSDQLKLTGKKMSTKTYYRHSRFFGSLKETFASHMIQKDSPFMISEAVRGMLPRNTLGRQLLTKLKVYNGAEHPHSAQKPQMMDIH